MRFNNMIYFSRRRLEAFFPESPPTAFADFERGGRSSSSDRGIGACGGA